MSIEQATSNDQNHFDPVPLPSQLKFTFASVLQGRPATHDSIKYTNSKFQHDPIIVPPSFNKAAQNNFPALPTCRLLKLPAEVCFLSKGFEYRL